MAIFSHTASGSHPAVGKVGRIGSHAKEPSQSVHPLSVHCQTDNAVRHCSSTCRADHESRGRCQSLRLYCAVQAEKFTNIV